MRKSITYLLLSLLPLVSVYERTALAQESHGNESTINRDFRILHHERMQALKFDTPQPKAKDGTSAQQAEQASTTRLSFDAYGRQFVVILKPNKRLIADLPKEQKRRLEDSMAVYQGSIDGIDDSWVRINRSGDRISGMMWDGVELYVVDTSDRVESAMEGGQADPSPQARQRKPYPLIYRLSDTESDTGGCAVDPTAKPLNNYRDMVDELRTLRQALPLATRRLDVAIVADRQFVDANPNNPDAAVVARMNVVDGIYSGQAGVQINVAEIRSLRSNGALTSSSASRLLDQFSGFAGGSGFNNPGLAHLFTGRNLDGNIIGVAFIGALCRKADGVGLSQTNGRGTAGALTVAHEMGHNFGSPHDNQGGSPCSSTPGNFLMSPFGNGSDQFSECSLRQMQPRIERAACISAISNPDPDPTPDPDPEPTPNPAPDPDPTPAPAPEIADIRAVIPTNPIETAVSSAFEYRVEVRNSGNAAATNATANISIPETLTVNNVAVDGGRCVDNQAAVNCDFGNLSGNTTRTVSVQLQAGSTAETLTSTVNVASGNDSNPGNNAANVRINVRADNGTSIFQSNFDADAGGFVFAADTFRGTRQPRYSFGRRLASQNGNGVLAVLLGDRDNRSVLNMSGGWRKEFSLSTPGNVTLSFDYRITQASNYEADEFSEALLSVDGNLVGAPGGSFLARITGDGNGGSAKTSGLQRFQVRLGNLSAGKHSISIGGFNNKKTRSDERTVILIDNVKADSAP